MINNRDIKEYSTVDIWIRKVCGSKETERNYLLRIEKFCKHYKINPDELIKKWKTVRHDWTERQKFIDEWSEKVEDYYALSDSTPLSKLTEISPIKSFFRSHRIPIEVRTQKHPHVTYHNRDITKSELRRILDHSELRDRTFFLMMAESGLRPSTLVQLKYRDIREYYENNEVPMKIRIRTDPNKFKDKESWTKAYKGWFFKRGQEREFSIVGEHQLFYAMELIKQSYGLAGK